MYMLRWSGQSQTNSCAFRSVHAVAVFPTHRAREISEARRPLVQMSAPAPSSRPIKGEAQLRKGRADGSRAYVRTTRRAVGRLINGYRLPTFNINILLFSNSITFKKIIVLYKYN